MHELGRLSLPAEYRRALDIKEDDELEITLENDAIIIRKKIHGCLFCGSDTETLRIGRVCICRECVKKLYDAKENSVIYLEK